MNTLQENIMRYAAIEVIANYKALPCSEKKCKEVKKAIIDKCFARIKHQVPGVKRARFVHEIADAGRVIEKMRAEKGVEV